MLVYSFVNRQLGSSLLELMISTALAMVSLLALASLVGSGIGLNARLMLRAELDEQLNAIVELIQRDMRRAGFSSAVGGQTDARFRHSIHVAGFPGEPNSSCVLYRYDKNRNGVLDDGSKKQSTSELFGFRLRDNNIEMRQNGLLCEQGGWQDLSDPALLKITQFELNVIRTSVGQLQSYWVELEVSGELRKLPDIQKSIKARFRVTNYDPL